MGAAEIASFARGSAALGGRALLLESGLAVLLAPGVGVDVEDVAVLSKAVDECAEAGGVAEDGGPLFVREVGGDDDRAVLVPVADDPEEQVGGVGVASEVSKLIDDEQVALGVAA